MPPRHVKESGVKLHSAGTVTERQIAATWEGMAYFSGTGPPHKKCRQCAEHTGSPDRDGNRACQAFKRMREKSGPPFPGKTAACKYFRAN